MAVHSCNRFGVERGGIGPPTRTPTPFATVRPDLTGVFPIRPGCGRFQREFQEDASERMGWVSLVTVTVLLTRPTARPVVERAG